VSPGASQATLTPDSFLGSPGSLIAYRPQSWRARGRLETLIEEIGFGAGPEDAIAHLESADEDVARAIDAIRSGQR